MQSFYVSWLRKGSSIKYVHNWRGDKGGSDEMRTSAYRGRGCHGSCVRTHLHYAFSCFWQHFCLIVYDFICRNLTLPLFKNDVCQKRLFFSNEINFCLYEISFFNLKLFFRTKVSKNAFNFNQIES